jgi:heterodisulfide reductase subunit E
MAVHAYIPEVQSNLLLAVTTVICLIGLYLLISRWGHGSPSRFLSSWTHEAFRDGPGAFLRVLVLDVFLFRRTWRRSKSRWAIHMTIFWGFIVLTGFLLLSITGHILLYLDPAGFGGTFSRTVSDLRLPYSLLGYLVLAASGIALLRRILVKKVRERTRFSDLFLIGTIFIIALTGMIAEWFSGYDTIIGPAIKNWDLALQFLALHLYTALLLFLMMIPWSRFRHIIATPLLLLARKGGV